MGAAPDVLAPRRSDAMPLTLVLGAAFGLLGDLLFHRAGLGLNAAVWVWALGIASVAADRRRRTTAPAPVPLLAVACFFAACVAWRASPFLRFWDAAAVAAASLVVVLERRGVLQVARLADYARATADLADSLVAGPLRALGEVRWLDRAGGGRGGTAVVTGAALTVPIVAVFGSLLAAADPVLESAVETLSEWAPEALVTHGVLIGAGAWLATGWLRRLATGGRPWGERVTSRGPALSDVSLAIPLGVLVALLAAFVGLQSRYLFGGAAFLQATGITPAEFARRGFFELVVLAALILPVLVGAQWLVDRGTPASVRSFRALAPTVAALVGVVMVSAVGRMWLYVRMYGLTEDRLYATAFMLWIGGVLVWFVATELGDRRERFATGGVAAGFALLAALNVMNPDAVIARVNLSRMDAATALDAGYLARLSIDAVPTIARRWATLDHGTRCSLAGAMARAAEPGGDWRAWTWSGWRAARAARDIPQPGQPCTPPAGAEPTGGVTGGP